MWLGCFISLSYHKNHQVWILKAILYSKYNLLNNNDAAQLKSFYDLDLQHIQALKYTGNWASMESKVGNNENK